MRLAVGRKGQTGRGRGIPVPGGVAHPFLLNKEAADYLYSISMGDEVEAKDEWGEWGRATVVAVRGEGGWVSGVFFGFFLEIFHVYCMLAVQQCTPGLVINSFQGTAVCIHTH